MERRQGTPTCPEARSPSRSVESRVELRGSWAAILHPGRGPAVLGAACPGGVGVRVSAAPSRECTRGHRQAPGPGRSPQWREGRVPAPRVPGHKSSSPPAKAAGAAGAWGGPCPCVQSRPRPWSLVFRQLAGDGRARSWPGRAGGLGRGTQATRRRAGSRGPQRLDAPALLADAHVGAGRGRGLSRAAGRPGVVQEALGSSVCASRVATRAGRVELAVAEAHLADGTQRQEGPAGATWAPAPAGTRSLAARHGVTQLLQHLLAHGHLRAARGVTSGTLPSCHSCLHLPTAQCSSLAGL